MKYEWLFFDADGTLFDFERIEALALERTFAACGTPYAASYLTGFRAIQKELWHAVEQGTLTPTSLRVQRFERLLADISAPANPAQFSTCFLQHLATGIELLPGARAVLEAVRGRFRLALLTNGISEVQRPRLRLAGLLDEFAAVIISEEVGVAKPNPAFFEAALQAVGQPPREAVLMIGDSWTADVQGAWASGLDVCWFNPKGLPRPTAPPIKCEIADLHELLNLLALDREQA